MDMWAPPVAREAAAEIVLLRDEIRRLRDENECLRKALGDFNEPKAWRLEASMHDDWHGRRNTHR
jgi:hypothetical protein